MGKIDYIKRNKEINNDLSQHDEMERRLRSEMNVAIYDMVECMGGRVESEDDDDDYPIFLSYDGGNHIEYASNMFSRLNAVFCTSNNGLKSFSVDIEDCDDYDEYRMVFADVTAVYEWVCGKFEEFLTENGND